MKTESTSTVVRSGFAPTHLRLSVLQGTSRRALLVAMISTVFLVTSYSELYGQSGGPQGLPDGDGKELVQQVCTQCHGMWVTTMLRDGPLGWKNTVDDMVVRGARVLPEEAEIISRYLTTNYGPDPSNAMKTGRHPELPVSEKAELLPAGAARNLVESRCSVCHDLGIVTALDRTREDWRSIVKDMFSRGITATPEEQRVIVSYLSDHFGQNEE